MKEFIFEKFFIKLRFKVIIKFVSYVCLMYNFRNISNKHLCMVVVLSLLLTIQQTTVKAIQIKFFVIDIVH